MEPAEQLQLGSSEGEVFGDPEATAGWNTARAHLETIWAELADINGTLPPACESLRLE